MNYLGVDIGTSGCKALLVDENGEQLWVANREYDVVFSDDGGAELDSIKVIQKCFEVINECTSKVTAGSVKGLGISSQGEAFTVIGEDNTIISPAMVSSDLRSKKFVEGFVQKFGEEKLYRITGHTAYPLFTVFKLLWLKENKPEIWKKARFFFCFEDLLQFHLGIEPAISWPLAGRTMMFDVLNHQWDPDILTAIEISPNQLAKPMPSGSIIGSISTKVTSELGLAKSTLVVAGGHDQPCSALGAGVTEAGMAMYATGTVECITPAFAKPIFSDQLHKNNLCTYDHTVKDMYTTVAFSITGGNILKWFRDEFAEHEMIEAKKSGKNAYELLLQQIGKKPTNLLVLPYFTPSGTPYFDTSTKGAILGLRLSTHRAEFLRALLEGVALEMRLNLEILEDSGYRIDELRAVGGGAKSRIWMQLKADVIGKKISIMNVVEAGCFGAAMLACAADTGEAIRDLAARWVKPVTSLHPQLENVRWYDQRFKLYRQLYETIKNLAV
jgi:xylulokinase